MKDNKRKISFWDSKVLKIIIAVILSVLLWSYVAATVEKDINRTFENIEIDFKGADTIRDRDGLVVTNVSDTSIAVTLKGSRRELSRLTAKTKELRAEVDVSKITSEGSYSLDYELIYPSGIDSNALDILTLTPKNIEFDIDKTNSKTIQLKGQFNGTVAEGYVAGPIEFEPSTVTINGPDTELAKIDCAWVDFDNKDINKTLEFDSAYDLRDSEGNKIELGNIQLETEMVSVKLPITSTKEVPLTVEYIEGAGATASNVKLQCEPSTITIAGDAETLEGYNNILVATVDLTSFASSFEETYQVVLDNSLTNVSGIRDVKVTVQVIGLETKDFVTSNISIINAPEGKTAEIVTKSIKVKIRGAEEEINKVQANNIRAVVDLTDIGETTGTIETTAKIYVDGVTGVGAIAIEDYPIYVKIE